MSFDALDIAASGANLGRTWLNAVAHNIANVNTVNPDGEEPFRAKLVVARESENGRGVDVVGIDEVDDIAPQMYDPTHPYASEEGVVTRPVVDLATQMADMIGAQRTYQANLSVIKSSRDAYASAMQIGR